MHHDHDASLNAIPAIASAMITFFYICFTNFAHILPSILHDQFSRKTKQ